MKQKKNAGITLIALVITIVVLLILAGVSIIAVISDEGLIKKAGQSKYEMQVAEEKQIIGLSNATGKIVDYSENPFDFKAYEEEIYKNAGNRKVKVHDNFKYVAIEFTDTNRYYQVEKGKEKVSDSNVIVKDKFPGDISNGGEYDGSVEKPFKINSIEDLVSLAQEVNKNSNNYKDKIVILERDLDFQDVYSYNDYLTTSYDIFLGGDGNTGLREQLLFPGKGFTPIGNGNTSFCGDFNGQNHRIDNIYMNGFEEEGHLGLFAQIYDRRVENLTISGEIKTESFQHYAGGIAGRANGCSIINCHNEANITAIGTSNSVGGICGGHNNYIDSCTNKGNISGPYYTGGIASGHGNGTTTVINCVNYGNINIIGGWGQISGILGHNGERVENCVNFGEIKSHSYLGGIVGRVSKNIRNCANFGKLLNKPPYTSVIATQYKKPFESCYYKSSIVPKGLKVEPELIDVEDKSMQEIADLLNGYKDPTTGEFPGDWKKWEVGEDGLLRIVN